MSETNYPSSDMANGALFLHENKDRVITLRLSGFRCYEEEQSFTFTSKDIIRVRGRSGIGKTTLFEAIQWVLYNYPTTNVYPRHGKTKNTSVTLTLPWQQRLKATHCQDPILTIERKKNPGLLVVIHPDGTREEDDVAQATIERYFGSRDVWRACCYLPQGENCPLLGFSNIQRMEILEALAFLNEEPEEDLEKIGEEIRRLKIEFSSAEKDLEILEPELDKIVWPEEPENLIIDDETRKIALARQVEIKTRIKALQQQYLIAEERKKQRHLVEERLKKNQGLLAKLEITNHDEINTLGEEIKKLQVELSFSQQIEAKQRLEIRQKNLLEQLGKLPVPERKYTQEEYQNTFSAEKKISDEQRIARLWEINYDPLVIAKRKEQIKIILDAQKDVLIWSRITNLEKKLETLTSPNVTQEDLEKAKEEFKALERSVDIHKCPSCKRSLRYFRNSLVLSETSPISADRIKKMKEALTLMEIAYRESCDRQNLTIQLESLLSTVSGKAPAEKLLKLGDTKKLEQEMAELGRLIFPEKQKISSHDIQKSQDYFNLQKELTSLEEELSRYPQLDRSLRQTQDIITQLNTCQERLRQLHDLLPRREMLESQIKTQLHDLEKLPLVEINLDELKRLQDEVDEIEKAFREDQEARDYLKIEEKYRQQEVKVNQLNTELGAAIHLKDLAQREICEILEEKIGTINLAIAEMCNRIFQDPISIELAMLKTTKTTKVTKPCVHLKIWYKDAEYDALSQLSGGEGKRISIAVSLALAQLNTFPMILMDECLNGLDDELKEKTLEVIAEISGEKAVICIMHDGIQGAYSRVISLDKEQ